MNILVTGGTGTVGSLVVNELVRRGESVQVLSRDPKGKNLPAGAKVVQGNLAEPATVRRVFDGVDAVFLLNVVSPSESHEGLLPVTAMRRARVKRVVYLSVHNADVAAWLPHFGAKVGIEEAIRRSGIPFTILRPNNFYQNDYWFKEPLLKMGVYPQPIGRVGLSRVDVRDIAEAAAVALTTSAHEGQSYNIVGPEAHTGESTAAVWSRAFGKPIAYGGDDLDVWEKQSLQYMPDWLVYDFRAMYEFFQEKGLKATAEDIERQTRLVGHSPRSFGAFAAETAAAWIGTAASR
jgi:uncharacterized protein YbjT (DUF2867 family)